MLPTEPRRCEPRRVNMTAAEYRVWYDECKLAEYEAAADNCRQVPITGYVVAIVESVEAPRPSEVVREVCRREHAAWVAMRWANFQRAVHKAPVADDAPILVVDWPVGVTVP